MMTGITQLSLSETDAATATKILTQYPHLKELYLSALTKSQVPWKKIPAGVTAMTTKEGVMIRPENPS